ncbi:MAG: 23S rRNA (guanine(2445)-N(2))/(guanine(2069)-N(7))-methyltransferase [Actinobacteria bacterium RBG_16_64_13]|nr:MAG: 23S rRNA (guanine(2445)-N(2))/(guanine(2069)-N(7))-methyltransferase [Actinobacteria bacterium RBG_16_64_13]
MPDRPTTQDLSFFATCPRNTEGLLLNELRALGAGDASETRAGVAFRGTLPLAYKVCLWSRVASRVILRLTSFAASSPDDLYEGTRAMPWEDHLAPTGTLAVEATSVVKQGPLADLNTHFAEQRAKDAVVDRFRERTGTRPGVDLARPDIRISLHVAHDEAVVGLDLSGEGLHRRGYRIEGGEAPLKENLAAAILMRAGWPQISTQGGTLLDPMCGSGTLLVEGALMAADTAPGLFRGYYGFLGWKGFDADAWHDLIVEATERRELGLRRLPMLFGFDIDPRALGTARGNIRRAGLAGRIALEQQALSALKAPDPTRQDAGGAPDSSANAGLVITNPPYGKRLGEVAELVEVYEALGERLKSSFAGWEAAIFTGNPELGAHLGLRAHRFNVLYNGPLECKLLLFHIGLREDGRSGDARGAGAEMFENRLRKNLKHLRRWAARENVHCYRLYDADLPEYAVAVDLYEDWAHVQEYAPPGTVDPVRARRRLKEVMAVVPEVREIPPHHTVLKVRRPQQGADQYQKLREEGRFLQVEEGGLRFLVNLTDYLDTGLFLDHRVTRGMIRELARGRRFLNLFAYTGSATVYAAAGGAASTTTVDLSPTYLDWAHRNLVLNGFAGPEHSFIRADCLEWLAQTSPARSGGRTTHHAAGRRAPSLSTTAGPYDLIFLDAPTFSNSKSMSDTLDIQRDHAGLIRTAAGLLSPGGILLFSTNFRRFKLDPAVAEEFQVDDITKQTIPPDFARNPRIHRCYRILPRSKKDAG